MNYSSDHEYFAYCLYLFNNINEQDVLNHPENYLGPNYKEVLNLWFYLDSLSGKQRDVYWDRYCALDRETHQKAYETSRKLASEIIDPRFVEEGLFDEDVLELISSHIYIERDIPFTFLPQIFDL